MQTTLECNVPAVTVEKPTLNYTDEHIEYLYRNFSYEGIVLHQIEKHLQEEKKKTDEIKEVDAYLQQFEGFAPKRKPQQYIRIGGKKC